VNPSSAACKIPLVLTLSIAVFGSLAGCGGGWTTPASDGTPGVSGSGGGSTSGGGDGGGAPPAIVYPPDPAGLHVVDNQILDAGGDVVVLRGVNRSGSEYKCVQNGGVFDGPSDEASIVAMTTWRVNAVRVPLNETCWLGLDNLDPKYSGDVYKAAITSYVNLLHKYKLTPIIELHWTAAGASVATGQQPMPDADHAPALWTDVATTFRDDTGVVFELFNEPYPGGNRDTDAAWACWRDGCQASTTKPSAGVAATFQAAGMQDLVTAVRNTGATQLILLGGVEFSNALSQWANYKPIDPLNNLAVAWHIYSNNACRDTVCWNSVLSDSMALGTQYPVVATEIGENDCGNTFINPLMDLLDAHGSGYLAWSWNSSGGCMPAIAATPTTPSSPGNPWPLVTDYASGTPSGDYALGFRDHLASVSP
jgi:endoglucanase